MRPLLDLVLPTGCAGCGSPGTTSCPTCCAALLGGARPAWPSPSPRGLPPPFAVAAYDGVARDLLLAYKEHGVVALRRPLGTALAGSLRAASNLVAAPAAVVPVPSTRAARRQRGADVVLTLARVAAGQLRSAGVPLTVVPALTHRRAVADSAGLGAAARAQNLAGAFRVRPAADRLLAGRACILVDDLITTGATAAECADALRRAGHRVAAVATVAATARHHV